MTLPLFNRAEQFLKTIDRTVDTFTFSHPTFGSIRLLDVIDILNSDPAKCGCSHQESAIINLNKQFLKRDVRWTKHIIRCNLEFLTLPPPNSERPFHTIYTMAFLLFSGLVDIDSLTHMVTNHYSFSPYDPLRWMKRVLLTFPYPETVRIMAILGFDMVNATKCDGLLDFRDEKNQLQTSLFLCGFAPPWYLMCYAREYVRDVTLFDLISSRLPVDIDLKAFGK